MRCCHALVSVDPFPLRSGLRPSERGSLVTSGCRWVLPPPHPPVSVLLSLWILSQAALQVGGHGERLCQCRQVVLTTSKAIPMQVDGEPCKLAASCIRISLRNQANMVQKTKRRNSMPLLNE